MGWDETRIEGISLGALIHDIGKISVPIEILSKHGKLMDLEFSLIKVHPESGYDILKEIKFTWPIAQMIYQHHERLDGSGYPNALVGEQIILEARVLAIADVVVAISSHRPYRRALGIAMVIQKIETNKGIFYDPEIVEICIRLLRNNKKIIELL